MKKDYDSIKAEIASALGKVSKHYEMSEACFHLRTALSIVEQREKKEIRRQRSQEEASRAQPSVALSPAEARASLSEIERMIEAENKRLKNLESGREGQQQQTIND